MNNRLQEIIKYKTAGRQNKFCELLGWSPQYLTKLLKGKDFGLKPIVTILEALPEINARWFLLGQGDMLEQDKLSSLRRDVVSQVQGLLDIERYTPVMSADELRVFEQAVQKCEMPVYSPDTLSKLESLISERERDLNAKIKEATAKSNELCNQ